MLLQTFPLLVALFVTGYSGLKPSRRIINGNLVDSMKYPYQVYLVDRFKCGGSIVNSKYIVTAAHCMKFNVEATPFPQIQIIRKDDSIPLKSSKRLLHPSYVNENDMWTKYDVALVQLAKPLVFSELVKPVTLPNPGQTFPDGTICQVSGYGTTMALNKQNVHGLRAVDVQLVDRESCRKAFAKFGPIDESTICARGGNADLLQGPCFGDSGGPLVCENVLTGIVAWGGDDKICNLKELPYVYANVANPKILNWIRNSTSRS